ncbi:hypothetical protein Lfu02_67870 [Longispora fulva]|uniref:Transcriptional regulator with XRE-family HTH domain n=1 Tax=Longispora fulva TaxID=619741 RepID=A0A8J7GU41_9ACTN|nr:helix-turn-helix domain-containing protein [Longispora fulva]MBG6138479.1 transcriptional regulator with XRE-family HTH domain [Longispora fulva]GIG62415.1 hypothetical protein Lfu02_67870 [Longispora fulva]
MDGPAFALARRLRQLRMAGWPGTVVTQSALATALGVSVPTVSAWESTRKPTTLPAHRIAAYATYFCTERSVHESRLLDQSELTGPENSRRAALERELSTLLKAMDATHPDGARTAGPWRFADGRPITIVCAKLPPEYHAGLFADSTTAEYDELYTATDFTALLELYGHVRAVNPDSDVSYRLSSDLRSSDYAGHHLVALGGVDWNNITSELLSLVALPVHQERRDSPQDPGAFVVTGDGEPRRFETKLRADGARTQLIEDVAHFFRAPSPWEGCTVTICNGNFGKGTLGIVRALADPGLRDSNAAHLTTRFSGDTLSLLCRVRMLGGKVITPDWTNPDVILHEWEPET